MADSNAIDHSSSKPAADLQQRHLIIGWLGLLLFLSLGIVLEMMHGFKVSFYLDVQNSTRRLMWTLSHAHGTLIAVVNIAFALTVLNCPQLANTRLQVNSLLLVGATILLPGGFFLAGAKIYSGDPGFGVFIVPIGGLLLIISVLLTMGSFLKKE
jgi:hypothetical protein